MSKAITTPSISVVIACYNGAPWLPDTFGHIVTALNNAHIRDAEIIVVNDGSTDGSSEVAHAAQLAYPVVVVDQPNEGRFIARRQGVRAAKYDYVFFVDTRVHIGANALAFVASQVREHPDRRIWNGHVYVAKEGNIIARFMDAVTFIGWRRYFAHPKTTSYGLKDFDYYPKGTGCFFVPKEQLLAAMAEFESTTTDLKFSSDDTLLIRFLARDSRINLSPQFDCRYFARTTARGFIKHTYHRGQFFVDGFLRPGTRFFWPLIGVLVGSVVGLVVLVGLAVVAPAWLLLLLALGVTVWLGELLVALALKVPAKDALSLWWLSPAFTLLYLAGIWRGTLRKLG